jgi:hypothetical protein
LKQKKTRGEKSHKSEAAGDRASRDWQPQGEATLDGIVVQIAKKPTGLSALVYSSKDKQGLT